MTNNNNKPYRWAGSLLIQPFKIQNFQFFPFCHFIPKSACGVKPTYLPPAGANVNPSPPDLPGTDEYLDATFTSNDDGDYHPKTSTNNTPRPSQACAITTTSIYTRCGTY